VFVDTVAELPPAILGQVKDGDVVIAMGAGTIAGVPARLVEMSSQGAQS
jgi:UDP-N-acetylmuramate--alanine ligase